MLNSKNLNNQTFNKENMDADNSNQGEEKNVVITYETLFEILRREKGREELQKLYKNFYQDVVKYLDEKKDILKKAQTTLFSSEEKEKTEIQLQNIRRIIKELYSRRERKIIETAIIKSRTQSNVIDKENMLEEEKKFFEEVVKVLDSARMNILFNVLEAKMPEIAKKDIDANLLTREYKQQIEELAAKIVEQNTMQKGEELKQQQNQLAADEAAQETQAGLQKESLETEQEAETQKSQTNNASDNHSEKKVEETKMVRFKCAVPRFYGFDSEIYGPFEEDDIACLQKEIADILIRKERAEEIKEE